MNVQDVQTIEKEEEVPFLRNFFQIDVLKAAMIFLVIFDHFVSWNIKSEIGVALWERISIPVFLVILGFNSGYSFRIHGQLTLRELYSWKYFKNKIERYIIPFLILYAVSTFIGLFMYGFDFEAMYFSYYSPEEGIIKLILLYLPFWGPGNWFIPVLISSIFVIPLIYWGFTKRPVISLILTFVIEIVIRVFIFFIIGESFTSWGEANIYSLISHNVLYRLSAVGLGIWFSQGFNLQKKRNLFMWILFPLSLVYLVFYQFFDFRLQFEGIAMIRGDYNLLVFPYSAFLVLLALKFLPNTSNAKFSKSISLIGKSTYHILLTQILGYATMTAWWGTHYGMGMPFDAFDLLDLALLWLLFIWFGIMWYKIDHQENITRRILYYINFFIIFPCIMLFTYWAQGFWIPIPLIVIILYSITALIFHKIKKKQLSTSVLGGWTVFLVISFISMILQVEFLPFNVHWTLLIPMGASLVFAIYLTISHKF